MRSLGIKFLAVVCLVLVGSPAFAQSASQPAEADIIIDFRMPKILNSELGTALGLEEKLNSVQPEKGTSPGAIVRIFAGIASPENVSALQSLKDGKGKVEFYASIDLTTAAAADKMIADAKVAEWTVVEQGGKSYYQPPEKAAMPAGTTMHRASEKSVVWNTPGFADQNGKEPFTAGLSKAWASIPDHALRISIDTKSASGFLQSLNKKGANPTVDAFMNMLGKTDSLNLSIDFASENLISLTGAASDGEKFKELKSFMESMVLMGKMVGGGSVEQLKQQDEEAAKVVGKIINGMKVSSGSENAVTFSIPRPEGMESVLKKAADQFGPQIQKAMNGGVGR